MRHQLALVSWLTVVWIGLWGDLSWANLAAGAAAGASVVLIFTPSRPLGLRVRPLQLVRFVSHFLANLVHASIEVAVIVVRPKPMVRMAVIAVPIAPTTRGVTLVIAAAISLTPGTLVIDARNEAKQTILYIHVLDLEDRDKTVAEVARLEQLATAAFGPNAVPVDLASPEGSQ